MDAALQAHAPVVQFPLDPGSLTNLSALVMTKHESGDSWSRFLGHEAAVHRNQQRRYFLAFLAQRKRILGTVMGDTSPNHNGNSEYRNPTF